MVILLTGPAGSGKTTVATLLADWHGWARVSEDEIWPVLFGTDRGGVGSEEHHRKRAQVHAIVHRKILKAIGSGGHVVVDATVHEAPPEAFLAYHEFFVAHRIPWRLVVLRPRLDIVIARDATRTCWHLGPKDVAELHAKFTGIVFDPGVFIDNSDETAEATCARIITLARARRGWPTDQ